MLTLGDPATTPDADFTKPLDVATTTTPTATLTLGAAAKHCNVSKGTISKAIASGKLSATRREDGSWSIDGAELHRYHQANGHRFRSETVTSEQPATLDPGILELQLRAELAELRLADLKEALADMRRLRDDMEKQRDKWETVAARLSLPPPSQPETAPATPETPRTTGWRWRRRPGWWRRAG